MVVVVALLVGDAQGGHVVVAAVEDLHPLVPGVNDVDVIVGIHSHFVGATEFVVSCAAVTAADSVKVVEVVVEYLNPVIVLVGHVHTAAVVHGQTKRIAEVLVVITRYAGRPNNRLNCSAAIQFEQPMTALFHQEDIAAAVSRDVGGAVEVIVICLVGHAGNAKGGYIVEAAVELLYAAVKTIRDIDVAGIGINGYAIRVMKVLIV